MISFINYIGCAVLSWHRKLRQVEKVTKANVCVCMSTCVYPDTDSDFTIALCLKNLAVHFSQLVPSSHLCGQYSYGLCFRSFKYASVHKYRCLGTYFFLQVTRPFIDLYKSVGT